jgi:serine phosphatase RsbU (regulator of sigma subunit)
MLMSSAGHPAPLAVRDDRRIREIGGSGPILGGWEGSVWEDRSIGIKPDETVLIYTDGVTDTRGERERFGAHRLRRLLAEHAGESPGELLSVLEAALDAFQVEGHSDDTGAVALRPVTVPDLRAVGERVPAGADQQAPAGPDQQAPAAAAASQGEAR